MNALLKTHKPVIRVKISKKESENKNALYEFELSMLQHLMDVYAHTGIEHYWEEAKQQSLICEKLSRQHGLRKS